MTLLTDVLRRRRALTPATQGRARAAIASRWTEVALISAAVLAVAFRCRMMLVGRSLWLDESALALNICGRSFAELLQPLDHEQGAPIGFLMLVKLATVAFGPTEIALRLVPFLASLATLYLIHRLCDANLGRVASVVGLALAGASPALVYYAGELKQYAVDVAVGLLVLTLAADALRLGLTRARWVTLALVGAGVVWLSHPAVFVLAGVGTVLIGSEVCDRRTRVAAAYAGIAAVWGVSFLVSYLLFLKDLGSNSFLAEFWEGAFLPFPPTSPRALRTYAAVGFGLFEAPFQNIQVDVDLSPRMGVLMAALGAIGVLTLARSGRGRLLALLLAPVAFGLVAAMLHKYPLKGRLALFTIAATYPTVAAGVAGLLASPEGTTRWVGRLLLAFALFLPCVQAGQFLMERPRLHDARGVLARVAEDWEPGDMVVVDRYSALPFQYYQRFRPVAGIDQINTTESELSLSEPEQLAREAARWKGHSRVWFVLDNALPDPASPGRSALFLALDREGQRLLSFSCRRYSAHLYRLD